MRCAVGRLHLAFSLCGSAMSVTRDIARREPGNAIAARCVQLGRIVYVSQKANRAPHVKKLELLPIRDSEISNRKVGGCA